MAEPTIRPVAVAALLTCHNRVAATLRCLQSLSEQRLPDGISVQVYLVDDGSSDGTGSRIRERFPRAVVITGEGNLFWGGGMRLAWDTALRASEKFDFFLWLNDDMVLEPGAVNSLLRTAEKVAGSRRQSGASAIVAGSAKDPETGELAYGGFVRGRAWRPLDFRRVAPTGDATPIDTMNGNCVLISAAAASIVGNIDNGYQHQFGDLDYGLRARKGGVQVLLAPGYAGTCAKHAAERLRRRTQLPVAARWREWFGTKGTPFSERKLFILRHARFPWLWPAYLVTSVLRFLMTMLPWHRKKAMTSVARQEDVVSDR